MWGDLAEDPGVLANRAGGRVGLEEWVSQGVGLEVLVASGSRGVMGWDGLGAWMELANPDLSQEK